MMDGVFLHGRAGLTDMTDDGRPFQRMRVQDELTDRHTEAEYTLEYPVKCPHCEQTISVLKVVRLLRTRVNFTSTLPRRGRAIACPECQAMLSAELSGIG